MKVTKFAAAVVTSAIALAALTGCTASDQRIIDSFFEEKKIAHPEKEKIEDPSMLAYRKEGPVATPTETYIIKVYGSVRDAEISVDGTREDLQVIPIKRVEESVSSQIAVSGVSKSGKAGCTIYGPDGTVLDKQAVYGKSTLFTCIYTK